MYEGFIEIDSASSGFDSPEDASDYVETLVIEQLNIPEIDGLKLTGYVTVEPHNIEEE